MFRDLDAGWATHSLMKPMLVTAIAENMRSRV